MTHGDLRARVSKALPVSRIAAGAVSLALASVVAGAPVCPALGATLATDSGVVTLRKPSMQELKELYASLPAHPAESELWSQEPDVAAYVAGNYSSEALAYGESYLNLVRRAANIDGIRLNGALNASAAQGALLLARLENGLTHYPATPSGVSDVQAEAGKIACAASNISYSWALSEPLHVALKGQMDDSDVSNMVHVGHRRWLLNPATTTFGMGSADNALGALYTCVRVFGSDVKHAGSTEYDYVAWPASGAFVCELFDTNVPWSVSLNSARYVIDDARDVSVRLERLADGRVWTLDAADNSPSENGEYLNVDSSSYGSGTCIVFRPNVSQVGEQYGGVWSVEISGLSTTSGNAVSLRYDVEFERASQEMYRLYNPNSGEHFYTGSASERNYLVNVGWRYEGVGWTAPSWSETPVYRLYNKNGGDHHYTTSAGERDALVALGWTYEGVGWYSNDAEITPVYRQYNPNATTGSHNFTTSVGERDGLVSVGWNNEGIAWYALAQ